MPKYHLVTSGARKVLLAPTPAKIVNNLIAAGPDGMSYERLARKTKSPTSTLYVMAQRLRQAGIVASRVDGDGTRILAMLDHKKTKVEVVNTLT